MHMNNDNKNVVFCTLAYGEKYREISRKQLLTSYNTYAFDYKLVVATDDPSYYEDDVRSNKNIIPIKIDITLSDEYKKLEWFPYNIKVFSVEYATNSFSPKCIVFLDADTGFTRRENFEQFLTLGEGLSVVLGEESSIEQIRNGTMRQKAYFLFREGERLYQFKEAGLIFRIESLEKMRNVLTEWKDIMRLCMENDICQDGECIDIALSCQRALFPILDLCENEAIYKLMGYGFFSTLSPYDDEYGVILSP